MLCNDEMRRDILSRLHGYRYEHTLGCERAAKMLAERFGGEVDKAAFAAILHDITKHFSKEEQLNLCEKYGIIPCNVEKSEPKMLHGKTAAAIARAEYGAPEDVCAAIACHTTGKHGMTLLDKILYLADYIEDTRDFHGVEKARKLARKDIDRALLYCYDQTLCELIGRGKLIHSDTIGAYNDLVGHGVRWREEHD
ncbi:MAG: bis(5'-nucleosyl)-tetraphosphatase (symmetrical) YqeK [Agathobaculum sp.]|uniref:bis(5'-nucleosyl)-tetraphosphatase (symmetrical) YqeK n=1 Tax=Agathobaculum sp. TaxID=2048138 RepID=UPI0025BCB793|nr:bis(5'-nucleosyl)-tetraphosphatase (symmetrical) YqeK [Agathobaculum sp.]MCI7125549.1 bis(5'-nucleosyl)-tetraphosphatase (symmetrical) YqeK [Agathobaculum sp.]MDY3712693.1 bis(5'-nucleosyl)-tetraphosphatase (symmetrical) YqeK [Agathobaculum sp.]